MKVEACPGISKKASTKSYEKYADNDSTKITSEILEEILRFLKIVILSLRT
jgi:hypothetical protein